MLFAAAEYPPNDAHNAVSWSPVGHHLGAFQSLAFTMNILVQTLFPTHASVSEEDSPRRGMAGAKGILI